MARYCVILIVRPGQHYLLFVYLSSLTIGFILSLFLHNLRQKSPTPAFLYFFIFIFHQICVKSRTQIVFYHSNLISVALSSTILKSQLSQIRYSGNLSVLLRSGRMFVFKTPVDIFLFTSKGNVFARIPRISPVWLIPGRDPGLVSQHAVLTGLCNTVDRSFVTHCFC